MRVLITGSSGYLGKLALNHLLERGHDVAGLDIRNNEYHSSSNGNFRFYNCDVSDRERVDQIISNEQPEAILHFACTYNSLRNRKKEYDIDVGGTVNVIESARRTPSVKKFVFSSSASIYGPVRRNEQWLNETVPVNPGKYRYGINKKLIEQEIFSGNGFAGLSVISLRICTVVGPHYSRPRSVVSILIRLPFLPASFRNTRVQFIHEEDFTELIGRVTEESEINGLYNLGPDSYTVVSDVVPPGRFHSFPCQVLKPVMWLLWNLHLVNLQPAGFGYSLNPVVIDSSRLAGKFNYQFRYTSTEAFLATCEKNSLPPGTLF